MNTTKWMFYKCPSELQIYLYDPIKNMKYWISNWDTYVHLVPGGSFDVVTIVDCDKLKAIPEGNSINKDMQSITDYNKLPDGIMITDGTRTFYYHDGMKVPGAGINTLPALLVTPGLIDSIPNGGGVKPTAAPVVVADNTGGTKSVIATETKVTDSSGSTRSDNTMFYILIGFLVFVLVVLGAVAAYYIHKKISGGVEYAGSFDGSEIVDCL